MPSLRRDTFCEESEHVTPEGSETIAPGKRSAARGNACPQSKSPGQGRQKMWLNYQAPQLEKLRNLLCHPLT